MNEEFRPILNFEGFHEVSNLGRVKCLFQAPRRKGEFLSPGITKDGYCLVNLKPPKSSGIKKRTEYVHVLMLETFIGPRPLNAETRHLDGNPLNNNLTNLAWGTYQEQAQDKKLHGRLINGTKCWNAKMDEDKVREIISLRKNGQTMRMISDAFGICLTAVFKIIHRKTWSHVRL